MELTPFSETENKKTYVKSYFSELGVEVCMLSEAGKNYSQFTYFKFGLIKNDGFFYWFFGGIPTLNNRKKAILVFNQLKQYCINNNLGEPFMMKVKKYHSSYVSRKTKTN